MKIEIKVGNYMSRGIRREKVMFHKPGKGYKFYDYPMSHKDFRDYVWSRIKQIEDLGLGYIA